MGSCLERCPAEVINAIVESIELHDIKTICNLRLACRNLAAKTFSSHRFQALFKSKHVELKEQALCHFDQGTQAGGLRCLIQNLTSSGFASGDKPRRTRTWKDKKLSSRQRNISLLSHAFDALAKNGPTGKLESLSLEVTISLDLQNRHQPKRAHASFDWRHVWMAAVDTFLTTLPALAGSRIQIESLTVFNRPEQQRCSLPCDVLANLDWDTPGLPKALSSVQALSISLSNRVFKTDEFEDEDARGVDPDDGGHLHQDISIAQDETNFTGLANLLKLLPHLKSIDWHYFRLRGELQHLPPWSPERRHERLLQHVVELATLPSLTQCSLRGVYARETDLLAFIKRTGAAQVRLVNLHLVSGTFRSIFDYCTSAAAPVTEVYFDNLSEPTPQSPQVRFFGRAWSRLGFSEEGYYCRSLAQSGKDIKRHIRYDAPLLGPEDSPALREWHAFQYREYGNAY
ncbi:hypothetical protein V491_03940 [Pseudogymnoascus sp. VKM F-3775]|nr:hypothetical protein V491_03940 [Pseudogymnoascus sp. VKM F-3775]